MRIRAKPFLGFLMLHEHDAASTTAVKEKEPIPEFRGASHAKRYETVNGLPIHAR
jgi:hypothetical protein